MTDGGSSGEETASRSEPGSHALELFLDLARIDSPTREEGAVAAFCAEKLSAIGFDVRLDDSADVTGSDTGNLIAELPGTSGRTLVLSAHMDCVEPCRGVEPLVRDGFVTSAGETVLGADDKVGIAVIIAVARAFAAADGPRPTLRVVLTVQEEIGLRGAKALDPSVLDADLCVVLDAEGVPGTMIVGAPTHYTFVASFEGRAAHAGVAPEQGVNAILMATRAVAAMEIGRLDGSTTANVGTIEGGSATNVVPDRVRLTGECRSLDRPRVEEVKRCMDSAMRTAAKEAGGGVDVEWTLEYESFALETDDPAVVLVSEACRDAGLTPAFKTTGGGSDANIMAAHGVPTVALSCGMTGVHSSDEAIAIADIDALARLVAAIVARMAA